MLCRAEKKQKTQWYHGTEKLLLPLELLKVNVAASMALRFCAPLSTLVYLLMVSPAFQVSNLQDRTTGPKDERFAKRYNQNKWRKWLDPEDQLADHAQRSQMKEIEWLNGDLLWRDVR